MKKSDGPQFPPFSPHLNPQSLEYYESFSESCMKEEEGYCDETDTDTETSDETDTDSETSDNQHRENTQSPTWSNNQLELLESALSSYHFLPRTTTEKVFTELQESDCYPCTKRMVRNWFSGREVMTSSAMDRWEARRKKLAMCDHAEGSMAKTTCKVK